MPQTVGCILLNWNGWQDTLDCLSAVHRLHYRDIVVVVVDNGSTDDSVSRIREAYPDLALIETGRNLGFAGGCNAGVTHALALGVEYVWLLNNDTLPATDALTKLIRKVESDSELAAVGSVLMYVDEPTKVQGWGGGRINLWLGKSAHALEPREDSWFDYITAASVLIRRQAIEQVGLLDDSFFLYWEDADLCFRLRSAGWKLGVAADSMVLHREHASSGRNSRLIDRYVIASGIRFLLKHAPMPWVSISMFIGLRVGKRLLMGQLERVGDITGGVKDYWARG